MTSKYGLHSGYFHPVLRQWQSLPELSSTNLMLPLFILDDPDAEEEVKAMPGVVRFGSNAVLKYVAPLVEKGLKAVLLFSVTNMEKVIFKLLSIDILQVNYKNYDLACQQQFILKLKIYSLYK